MNKRIILCGLIFILTFSPLISHADSIADIRGYLELKFAIDTDGDGLSIADIVRYMNGVDKPIEREQIIDWLAMIDVPHYIDLERFIYVYQQAADWIGLIDQKSGEAGAQLLAAVEAAESIFFEEEKNQRLIDEHTLALSIALMNFQDEYEPAPLFFTSPAEAYVHADDSYGYHYFYVSGGIEPYEFSLLTPLPDDRFEFYDYGVIYWNDRLDQEATYSFTVQVTDSVGTQVTQDLTIHSALLWPMVDLSVYPGAGQAQFEFPAPIGAQHVRMMYSMDQGATWELVPEENIGALDATSTSAVVTGLENGVTYHFRLDVTGGLYPGMSNIVEVQPNLLTATSHDQSVVLHFQPGANLSVQQSVYGGLYWEDAAGVQIGPEDTRVTIPNLMNGKVYMFRLLSNGEVVTNEAIAVPQSPREDSSDNNFGLAMRTPDSVIITFKSFDGMRPVFRQKREDESVRELVTLDHILYDNSTFVIITGLSNDAQYEITASYSVYMVYGPEILPSTKLTASYENENEVTITHSNMPYGTTGRLQRLRDGESEWIDVGAVENFTPFTDHVEVSGTYHYRLLIANEAYFEVTETATVHITLP